MMRSLLAVLALGLFPLAGLGQSERYELGRRLKRFEEAWEKQPDPAARKRAAAILPDITPMFFSLRFGDAGKTLDRARHLLAGPDEPTAATQWLESLYAVPEKTLYTDETEVVVTVKPFYAIKGGSPPGTEATLRWNAELPVAVPLAKLPAKVTIPRDPTAKHGVARLTFSIQHDGKTISKTVQRIAFANELTDRLKTFQTFARQTPATIETATVKDRAELLEELAAGTIPETDLPGLALLEEAKRILETPTYFGASRTGQFWLSVPLDRKKTQPLRLFVPKGLDAKKSVPIVVALHGAGGSENLFFEGYGAGHIVKECEKRGWLLVAPRSPLGFGSGPPLKAILDRLGERYPIDRAKVFLVGHSMGAAQTVALCQQHPDLFAAAAALGGGGRVQTGTFPKRPFFVGVGDKDFALTSAKALAKAVPDATYKEYAGLEHMLIVREALPDVFAMWDKIAK
jgi:predicted esterase